MNKYTCSGCGVLLDEDELTELDGLYLCQECYEDKTDNCSHCGERIWLDDNFGSSEVVLCENCYDQHYTHCENCGCLISYNNAFYIEDCDDPFCEFCYNREVNSVIHNYNYKPEPLFYGDSNIFLGVELEVDKGGEITYNAEKVLEVGNADDEHIYIKHDGSLNNGFEVVTFPMSLDYHLNNMPWDAITKKLLEYGYRGHNTSTAGIHVHINRSAFGHDFQTQDESIGRLVYFFEANWAYLKKFSRRTTDNLNRWASRYGIESDIEKTYSKAKKGNLGRYVCINLFNSDTVEIRIFRSTLKTSSLLAILELVHEIVTKAISMDNQSFEDMSWLDFVSGINSKEKPELVHYLKEKQLYINEPITESEEI